jgi:DNA invertase Pin-like site-specific DNA recombinase
VQVYRDSEISGVVARARPGYQAVMAAAKAAEFDVLITDELSRLARNPEELAGLRNRFRFWGVGLVALGDGLDTVVAPGSAAAIMAIKGVVNESELEANAFRSWRGLEGRVLAGQHAGGAPFGYRTKPVHADRPGDPPGTGQVIGYDYVIHEGEAETIRRIFQLYAQGSSPRRIAALLNAEGVPSPAARWRDRNGSRRTWSVTTICGNPKRGTGILNQAKYAGQVYWNRSTWPRDPERDGKQVRRELPPEKWVTQDAPNLRIVPQDLWDAAKARQRQMSTSNGSTTSHKRHRRLLSGLLTCANCGSTLVLRGTNTYGCAGRHDRGPAVCDTRVTVNVAEAETTVLQVLQEALFSEDLLADVTATVRRHLAQAAREKPRGDGRQTALRAQLAEVEATIGRLTEAIAQGLLVEDLQRKAAEA